MLLVICGATATGKTALAVDCALKLGSEVVSADSQLVYRGLDIGTAKPTEKERRGVRHHMIDVVDPRDEYSVSDYERQAGAAADSIISSGRIPVICGGTGFYINSLLFDISYGSVPADSSLREKYAEIADKEGKEYLYGLLKSVDPATAEKLHPNDLKRVIRAIEIFEIGGRRKSEIGDSFAVKRKYLAVAPDIPRDELYERIDGRVDRMFDCGLVDEVKGLLNSGVSESCRALNAIGYKEVVLCLKNGDNESTMRDIIKRNTRRYAKRQMTFFKKMPEIVWLNKEQANADYILELLNDRQ